ncbi:MAG: KpsF/GutQ family sugar-phosphate isomerase [Bacteroidetes bacterium]|nr:MAG: KpsF/GutQ family sugar-phosphate isomerase [Bacteroidota bacterium]
MLKTRTEIKNSALTTIQIEAEAIVNLKNFITDDFALAVEKIINTRGRVVITGIGKSAIIATKIVATLNSTGTPAIFMHAADAIHGDLGILQKDDIALCISNSGNSPEIKVLTPMLKSQGNCLIAMVGNLGSYLARQADLIINTTVEKEASPGNLAPTASTTAQLVMGDALAMALLECRGFTASDFARYHPGGALGKQLYLKVDDLFDTAGKPVVNLKANIREVILEISTKRLGATAVLDGDTLLGVITDGDLRRMLQNRQNVENLTAGDIMSQNPKTISKGTLAVEALQLMRNNNITQVLVMDNVNYIGMIHLHDILKEGII